MVKYRLIIISTLILFSRVFPFLQAEITTTVNVGNYNTLYALEDERFALMNFSRATVNFKSKGSPNVKGELQIESLISDRMIIDIPRAYIKVRFPWFDLTTGKTRLSWGEGFAFNAGDIIFNGMSPVLDLSAAVLRNQTAPLAAVTSYFTPFTFLELVALPGSSTIEFPAGSGIYLPAGIDAAALTAGGRFSAKIGQVNCEAGYLYKGKDETHNPYFNLHSALFNFFDFYLAASCSLIHGNTDIGMFKQSVKGSFGVFTMAGLGRDLTINFRMEAGLYPFAGWQELTAPAPPVAYGLFLYPEISLSLPENLNVQTRALISPIDGSGIILGGVNWNLFQGFTLGALISCMFGDNNDLYGWNREGGLALMLNAEYLFGG